MADLIHLYKGTVTSGGTNGTLVSNNGKAADGVTALDSPVTFGPLNATNNEVSASQQLALRCDSGYTTADCAIQPVGTSAAKVQLSLDGTTWANYGASLSVGTVGATNRIIYARAKATSDENPSNDVSVDLQITATVAAV